MKKLFRSKITLLTVYVIMLAVAVFTNISSGSIDVPNIIVTGVMFLIVLILFIYSFRRFSLADAMIEDFDDAAQEIRSDYRVNDDQILWKHYRNKETNLFSEDILADKYNEYRNEIARMEELSGDVYRCDIEDYINIDTIDAAVSRNVLNLVSGTMTGLGILGTFVGLTVGLQHFSTGTADEISQSISPLIQGIKVAFYTSIYGMVFSLIFSFIYRGKMEDVYAALDRFLDAYKGCVLPDSKGEGFRQLLEFEKKSSESMLRFATQFGTEVGNQIADIVTPQFDRMNGTIERFAQVATQAQLEGLARIVDRFIELMSRTLGNSLQRLGECIDQTVEWQKEDRSIMEEILQEVGRTTADLQSMNDLSQRSMQSLAAYVDKLDRMQGALNEGLELVQARIRETVELGGKQQAYLRNLSAYEQRLSDSAKETAEYTRKSYETLKDVQDRGTAVIRDTMEKYAVSSQTQITLMGESASRAAGSLERAAVRMTEASEVAASRYQDSLLDTSESLERMQKELKSMIYAVDSLRRNVSAFSELKNN